MAAITNFCAGCSTPGSFHSISQIMSRQPPLSATVSSVDLDGDGTDNSLLPGTAFNGLGRGTR